MIVSILDNDLYKFSMQQFILHNFRNVEVEYDLSIRSDVDLRPYKDRIWEELKSLIGMQLHPKEQKFLSTIRYLSEDYIEWLSDFRFNPFKHINIRNDDSNLKITIKGSWLHTILYEVPVLAIISEVFHEATVEGEYTYGNSLS